MVFFIALFVIKVLRRYNVDFVGLKMNTKLIVLIQIYYNTPYITIIVTNLPNSLPFPHLLI